MSTRAEIPVSPVHLQYPSHSFICTSCPYNGRTDKEAEYAHLSCKGYKRDIMSDQGRSYVRMGSIKDESYFTAPKISDDYLQYLKGAKNCKHTELDEQAENKLLSFFRDFIDLSFLECLIFQCRLHGLTYEKIGEIYGCSKQHISQIIERMKDKNPLIFGILKNCTDEKNEWASGYKVFNESLCSERGKQHGRVSAVCETLSDVRRITEIPKGILMDRLKRGGGVAIIGGWRISESNAGYTVANEW